MVKGRLIAEGRTAEVFQWENDKIIKLFRPGIPKAIVENEYNISTYINKHLDITPRAYDLLNIEDRNGIIYERINGATMMGIVASKPWTIRKEARLLAELHNSIHHKVAMELPNLKMRLKDNISKTELLDMDTKNLLHDYIDRLEDGTTLCHGDFHPDNILITKTGPVIIDWMTATKGNPLADVARTSIMFKLGVVPHKTYIANKILNFGRNKFYSEYIKHYMKISGFTYEQISKWELPVAAARLLEGIPQNEKAALLNLINTTIRSLNH